LTGRTVWLASYPRSGNTWFRAVFSAWRTGGPPNLDHLGTIASSRERFDDALGISSSDLTADEVDRLRPRADEVVDMDFGRLHLEKIHDRLSTPGGPEIVSAAATHCAIYLMRDPRDVAVSLAHQNGLSPERAGDMLCDPETAIADRTDDISDQLRQRLGTWSDHVSSWIDSKVIRVHVVRFEDCVADPGSVFSAALTQAGFTVSRQDIAAAVEHASFERLQSVEAAAGFRENRDRQRPFFRRGRPGAWHDELRPEVADRIAEAHREVMGRFGYRS
jgi:aryl sulfotransferase